MISKHRVHKSQIWEECSLEQITSECKNKWRVYGENYQESLVDIIGYFYFGWIINVLYFENRKGYWT